ncbi:hypothetical protein FH972_024311 [Carpinus fangiana]|uniref:Major facilitator superfamily (MFS) profile domain-containing protein n=1 Tax=Carpinus fangiana TaxID=176857 RepID=A0A5N6KY05_9ROSI|nr:hypothetical protein FH972_024311 [Carpinus fangiana]
MDVARVQPRKEYCTCIRAKADACYGCRHQQGLHAADAVDEVSLSPRRRRTASKDRPCKLHLADEYSSLEIRIVWCSAKTRVAHSCVGWLLTEQLPSKRKKPPCESGPFLRDPPIHRPRFSQSLQHATTLSSARRTCASAIFLELVALIMADPSPADHTSQPQSSSFSGDEKTTPQSEHQQELVPGDDGVEWKPGYRFYLAFSALAVLALMASLDGTSVSVALPVSPPHGPVAHSGVVHAANFSAVFQPPIAALSHIFGRMYTLSFCTLAFLVGIIISSVANDFTVMLVGRTIQGIGGGGIILLNDIIITDLVPMRLRGAYFGMIGGVWAFGSTVGPVIGGVLAYKATWRWIFWINIPFGVISLIIVPLFMRLKRTPGSIVEKLARVDWVGNFVFIGATTSFLIPVTWGGVQFPWDSVNTLVPLILGVVALGVFGLYELYIPKEPTIRIQLLANYNLAFSLFGGLINALIVYGSLYFLPLFFEACKGYNPVLSGIALFPATFTVAPVSILSGVIITKTGNFRVVTWVGWVLSTLGLGVMVLLDADSSPAKWVFITLCVGIGLGFLYTSLALVNQSASNDENMAFAVSLFIFARALGQCIGVAICGTIFQNQMRERLLSIPSLASKAVEYSRDASSLVWTIKQMSDGVEKTELITAYADSLKIVWAVMCALSGVAMIGSIFLKHESLDRKLNTEQALQEKE